MAVTPISTPHVASPGRSEVTLESSPSAIAAVTDADTGLPNRLHFDLVYRVVFAAGTRGFPVTLLLLHAGSEGENGLLGELAERLGAVTRQMDLLARFDPNRFAILLLGCNVHGGRVAAERLLEVLRPWLDDVGLRVDVGVSALTPGMEEGADLMRMAEAALASARESTVGAVETRP